MLSVAGVSRAGAPVLKAGSVADVADEAALIVWDEATKTQHLVFRVSFLSQGENLCFLVPTPSEPKVGKADDEVFTKLAKLTAAKEVKRKLTRQERMQMDPYYGGMPPPHTRTTMPTEPLRVVGTGRVGYLEHATLQASSATDLEDWLKKNGFDFRLELREWLREYVGKKWHVTAFKFSKAAPAIGAAPPPPGPVASSSELSSSAIRMTFKTDQPTYTYSEPLNQREAYLHFGSGSNSRLLRVYFLGKERHRGHVSGGHGYWNHNVVWANPISNEARDELLDLVELPEGSAPNPVYLTEFEDRQPGRPERGDLVFVPEMGTGNVSRPEVPILEPPDPGSGPNPARSFTIVAVLGGGAFLALFVLALFLWRATPEPAA
jgi:hypothetical protein